MPLEDGGDRRRVVGPIAIGGRTHVAIVGPDGVERRPRARIGVELPGARLSRRGRTTATPRYPGSRPGTGAVPCLNSGRFGGLTCNCSISCWSPGGCRRCTAKRARARSTARRRDRPGRRRRPAYGGAAGRPGQIGGRGIEEEIGEDLLGMRRHGGQIARGHARFDDTGPPPGRVKLATVVVVAADRRRSTITLPPPNVMAGMN